MKEKYAVVLAGGGAKGSYQIGAWKALKEMGIQIEAVCGASVGALNAALMAQGDLETAEDLWNSMTLDRIVRLPEDLLENGALKKDLDPNVLFSKKGYSWTKNLFKTGGLDTDPLKDLIKTHVGETKLRAGSVDLGLVTYNLSSLKPEKLFLEEIPEGLLGNYLLASASFPLFKRTEIDGKKFTDGGISDNIPYQMMKDRGYRNIIILDISGLGMNKRPHIEGTRTIYIQNSVEMGGVLDFSREFLDEFKRLGYLDTLQAFGKLRGRNLFLTSEDRFERKFMKTFLPESPDRQKKQNDEIRSILPPEWKKFRNPVLALAECTALSLRIPKIRPYSFKDLLDTLEETKRQAQMMVEQTEEISYTDAFRVLLSKRETDSEYFSSRRESPYTDLLAVRKFLKPEMRPIAEKALFRLFPSLPGAVWFLNYLENQK